MSFISIRVYAFSILLLASPRAVAQYSGVTLKSFGFTNLAATHPQWAPIEATNETNNIPYSLGLYGTTSSGGIYGNGTLYRIDTNGAGFEVVHHFQGGSTDGAAPGGSLFELNATLLAGVTSSGGANGLGTLFSYDPFSRSNYHVIHHFAADAAGGGANPVGSLAGFEFLSGPQFFGVTLNGGSHGFGSLYRINHNGGGFTVLKSFTNGLDGAFPTGGLILIGSRLYGTTSAGGTLNAGVLYSIEMDGSAFAPAVNFGGSSGSPPAGPIVVAGGFLYGMTTYGGASNQGLIYRVRPIGTEFSVVRSFSGGLGDGAVPKDRLSLHSDGFLYGTTSEGGFQNFGILFRIEVSNNANYQKLSVFSTLDGGGIQPVSSVSRTLLGTLFGVAPQAGFNGEGVLYASLLGRNDSNGRLTRSFWQFSGTGGDALNPVSPLLLSVDGFFYGVAPTGGTRGGGAIYRTSKSTNTSSVLWSFGPDDADVRHPVGGLLEASDGLLYGVVRLGGPANSGAVFRLSRQGANWVSLKGFGQPDLDGAEPNSRLIEGQDGLLYGTTTAGGAANLGTIFRLEKSGANFLVIHPWTGGVDDGALPNGVIEATDGWLYGSAGSGGSNDLGIIFKLQRDGSGFTILRHCNVSGGYQPEAGLMEGSDGLLYGTARFGGSGGVGTVFKLGRDGSGFAVIKNFSTSIGDAEYPVCALVEGSDRALYGVSAGGGAIGYGAVFRVMRDGSGSSVIRSFTPLDQGGFGPVAGLVKDTDGSLYGVTEQGGDLGKGTLFKLVPQWSNHPPLTSNPVGTRTIAWAAQTSFAMASNTFTDPDANQVLSYTASGQPTGLSFTGTNRTFSGKAMTMGDQVVTVVATDNGTPALSAVEKFKLSVVAVPPRLAVSDPGGPGGISLQATNGQTVVVELSTNLFNWLPFSTNTIVVPPLFLIDPGVSNRSRSFYRALIRP